MWYSSASSSAPGTAPSTAPHNSFGTSSEARVLSLPPIRGAAPVLMSPESDVPDMKFGLRNINAIASRNRRSRAANNGAPLQRRHVSADALDDLLQNDSPSGIPRIRRKSYAHPGDDNLSLLALHLETSTQNERSRQKPGNRRESLILPGTVQQQQQQQRRRRAGSDSSSDNDSPARRSTKYHRRETQAASKRRGNSLTRIERKPSQPALWTPNSIGSGPRTPVVAGGRHTKLAGVSKGRKSPDNPLSNFGFALHY